MHTQKERPVQGEETWDRFELSKLLSQADYKLVQQLLFHQIL